MALEYLGNSYQKKNISEIEFFDVSFLFSNLFLDFCRGFNDAINGFNDDGWSLMQIDGAEDLIISVNSAKNLSTISNSTAALSLPGGILCVKAAMLLQVSCRMIPLKLL